MSNTQTPDVMHDCDMIEPAIVAWMEGMGFEYTNNMGHGLMFNHKAFVSKEHGVVYHEHAVLFYNQRQALLQQVNEQIIGKDELTSFCPCAFEHRNALRDVQRTKLKQLKEA